MESDQVDNRIIKALFDYGFSEHEKVSFKAIFNVEHKNPIKIRLASGKEREINLIINYNSPGWAFVPENVSPFIQFYGNTEEVNQTIN